MLVSLQAGGVGLNLIGANHLFLLDMHWNPALEKQVRFIYSARPNRRMLNFSILVIALRLHLHSTLLLLKLAAGKKFFTMLGKIRKLIRIAKLVCWYH